MAAGKGTRLKSKRPKVLHEIGGKPLLAHVISAASKVVDPKDVYVVVGHQAEKVQAAVAFSGVNFVLQTDQLGTGHAIQAAQPAVQGYHDVLVLSGDAPMITARTIELMWSFHQKEQAAMTLLSAIPEHQYGYGRVIRNPNSPVEVEAVVEQKSATQEQLEIREVNSGFYAFQTAALVENLQKLRPENSHREFYLTDMAKILTESGQRVVAVQAPDPGEILGANTIAELVALDSALRLKTAMRLMSEGVTIFKPETCIIDADVEIGADTIIEPYVQILGKTRIGADCFIRSGTVIEAATIADSVLIRQSCVIAESNIRSGAKIGPFAHIRPASDIGEEAHIGNFVEIKKSRIGKSAKASHLTYLGDAEVGADTNIGAGVITCNFDGARKHNTTIGAGAFVGSDSTLVAPVTIGDGAYIGAGSCITREVPANSLAVGRSRQIVKEGWAVGKRARLKNEC